MIILNNILGLIDEDGGQIAILPVHKLLDLQSEFWLHILLGCEKEQSDSQHDPWDGLQLEPGVKRQFESQHFLKT